jgi:NAD-dependent deacetylase
MKYASSAMLQSGESLSWAKSRWEQHRKARPTAFHRFLARLEQKQRHYRGIHQNVDGLHLSAGCSEEKNIEIHGALRQARCCNSVAGSPPSASCPEELYPIDQVERCPRCSGPLRPNILGFDEDYSNSPSQKIRFEEAMTWITEAAHITFVGTSGTVNLAHLAYLYNPSATLSVIDPRESVLVQEVVSRNGEWFQMSADAFARRYRSLL